VARHLGANLVVVYEPGSVADLCLLWCLRAANGVPYGFPLGVPTTESVVTVVREWLKVGAGTQPLPGLDQGSALVSESVDRHVLSELAAELGAGWSVVDPGDVLRAAPPPARPSTDIAAFRQGSAQLSGWGPEDIQELGTNHSYFKGLNARVRLRPLERVLPPSRSLAAPMLGRGDFRGGCFECQAGEVGGLVRMRWPTGWTVLRAFARDRGLDVRPSEAGRAAEAFVYRLGSLGASSLLGDPAVISLLYQLGERKGITWFRARLDGLLARLDTTDSGTADSAGEIDAYLAELAASHDDADTRSVAPGQITSLGSQKQKQQWLEWAEDSGVLIRGTSIECDRCGAKSWRTVAELAPPLICPGCAEPVSRPYRHDILQFRYRASETLLRLLEFDALGHVLTLAWMVDLFHVGFERPERLYGGHPGVEFLDEKRRVVGEADVFLLFADGRCAVGEYKRSANGLKQGEIDKLDALADRIDAEWTFVATHDAVANCPAIWKDCQQEMPDRPRFSLTGERLFDHARWAMGNNPFAWPEPADEQGAGRDGTRTAPGEAAEWMARFYHPDAELFLAWDHEDSESGNAT
jgi:hypothetical protein